MYFKSLDYPIIVIDDDYESPRIGGILIRALVEELQSTRHTALLVSPPKPCRYCGSPGRVWLNSTSASPSATTSHTACLAAVMAQPRGL